MKKIFKFLNVLIFAFSFLFNSKGQDLIVTNAGDSLNCKITKVQPDYVYFTFNHKGEIRNTLLPANDIKYYSFKYFKTSEVPIDKVKNNETYQKYRFAFNAGWSSRLAKNPENLTKEINNYLNELKSGFNLGADISYFFSEKISAGIKYCYYNSKNKLDNYTVNINGQNQTGTVSDNISINFIGATLGSRYFNYSKKNALIMAFGLGYMDYTDKAVIISPFNLKGKTLGVSFDVGYDIAVSEKMALGIQLSLLGGSLTKMEMISGNQTQTINLDKDSYESLSRIDISVGIRFLK